MKSILLQPEIQDYIQHHLDTDPDTLVFKKSPFPEVSMPQLIQQIKAKQKIKKKLPTWFGTSKIYYPEKISLEQTSSEKTATYKASLMSGKSVIDLTGGFGVDCFSFAKKFERVTHLEINKSLSEIAASNFKQLGLTNIACEATEAISFLKRTTERYDWIYADPSRRDHQKGKVFLLSDCTPDIPKNLSWIWNKTNQLFLKTAPLLDIQQGINELQNVKEVHVVALKNEVKELNWILKKAYEGPILITCINLDSKSKLPFSFEYHTEKDMDIAFSNPLSYLYEPNAAILKAGAFKTIAHQYNIAKIARHSHLYTSMKNIAFPGRSFLIKEVLPFQKKSIKKRLAKVKAHITTRNFPWSVAKLRKEFQIHDGGDLFIFFTTNLEDNYIAIICKKTI
ncbi:THUMP-like domain-containing protein [Ascidiimonas sp. W6]|uniref:THUMP-like domain-containing protein n=1 Tax=Ascidiimonas meishanensis TaxID=3128903 RepID=UPI0030EEFD8E